MSDEHGAGGPPAVEYEKRDVDVASVTRAGLIVVGVSALTALLLVGYVGWLMRAEARRAPDPRALSFAAGRQPPTPRLQELPFQDIRGLHAEEDRVLSGYGWVDRPAGVVRIPVDDAMELFVKRAAEGRLDVGPAPPPAGPPPSPSPGAAGAPR